VRPECVDADPASYLSLGLGEVPCRGEADERGLVSLRSGVVFLAGLDVQFVGEASFREGCVQLSVPEVISVDLTRRRADRDAWSARTRAHR
jgi:hypothetical protein